MKDEDQGTPTFGDQAGIEEPEKKTIKEVPMRWKKHQVNMMSQKPREKCFKKERVVTFVKRCCKVKIKDIAPLHLARWKSLVTFSKSI